MADSAAERQARAGGVGQAYKDVVSGAAGGIVQVLIGQPFDIVKVRLQTSTARLSAASTALFIYRNEGALAFYKGTLTPLLGIGACVSIQFGAFHVARRFLESYNARGGTTNDPALSYPQYYLAGAFAGLSNSVISGPVEHVRIRFQTQPHDPARRLYSGLFDCVRKLACSLPGGLYRGQCVTFLREAQSYGFWFFSFEWLMNADARRNRVDRSAIPAWKVALYGGLAGEVLWLASYPLDLVKSKMQTDGFASVTDGPVQKYSNMRDCFAKTWRAEGMGGFWKGLGPTLLRAMPVSAGTFAAVEMTMRALG